MGTSINPAIAAVPGGSTATEALNRIANSQSAVVTGSNINTTDSRSTTTGGSTSSALQAEATMKQQVSALVGDGKAGQYASHKETAKAINDKYQQLKGAARAEFAAKADAIGEPLGVNFGLKGADGKPLNSDVQLSGDFREVNARLNREFNGQSEPVAQKTASMATPAAPTPAAKAAARDTVEVSDLKAKVKGAVQTMDTSGDGKVTTQEIQMFAARAGTPVNDKVYNDLLQQASNFEEINLRMPAQAAVDFLLNSENKGTVFVQKDVANATK